jgi:hypothetical protein
MGGWVDLRAGLDDLEKRKFLTLPGIESDPSVVQPVASRYTDYAIPAPNIRYRLYKMYSCCMLCLVARRPYPILQFRSDLYRFLFRIPKRYAAM